MNLRRHSLFLASIVALCFIGVFSALAGTVTEPTVFRDTVKFRGSTGPDFDSTAAFSIGGTKVTSTAAQLNAAGSESALTVTQVVGAAQTGAVTATGTVAVTVQTVTIPAGVTNATLTLQSGDVVFGDYTNSLLTNVILTLQSGTAALVVTNTTAIPTINVIGGGAVYTNYTLTNQR